VSYTATMIAGGPAWWGLPPRGRESPFRPPLGARI